MKHSQLAGCLWRYDYLIFPIYFQCAGTAGSKQSVTIKPVIERAKKRRLSPEDKWQHKRKQLQAIYWTADATKGDTQLWQSHMLSSTLQNSRALSVSAFPCQSQTSWSHSFADLRLPREKHWMLQWVSGLTSAIDSVAPGQGNSYRQSCVTNKRQRNNGVRRRDPKKTNPATRCIIALGALPVGKRFTRLLFEKGTSSMARNRTVGIRTGFLW